MGDKLLQIKESYKYINKMLMMCGESSMLDVIYFIYILHQFQEFAFYISKEFDNNICKSIKLG